MGYKRNDHYLVQKGGLWAFDDLLMFEKDGEYLYEVPYDKDSDGNDMTWERVGK